MTSWRSILPLVAGAVLVADAASAEGRTIKGTVIDSATKQGLRGATVAVKGTPLTALTGPDGTFSLAGAPDGELVLSVRAESYASREVTLPAQSDEARVVLSPESMGEEIVVTGRASATKRQNVPVSITKVKSEDLTEVSAETVDQVLQGKVAGPTSRPTTARPEEACRSGCAASPPSTGRRSRSSCSTG